MKFCIDCVHYTPNPLTQDKAKGLCGRSEAPRNRVTGDFDSGLRWWYCHILRESSVADKCGPTAIHFSAKEGEKDVGF